MSAVHTYIVERPMPTRSVETAWLKHWPLLAAVVGTPIALVIIQVMAAALGH